MDESIDNEKVGLVRYHRRQGASLQLGVCVAFTLLCSGGAATGLDPIGDLLAPESTIETISLTHIGKGNIFVVHRGDGDKIIQRFKSSTKDNVGDKIRLAGFGITSFDEIHPLLHQYDDNVLLELPNSQRLWILGRRAEEVNGDDFQLELDRKGLTETFSDNFDTFSWYAEGAVDGRHGGGTWRTHLPHGAATSLNSRRIATVNDLQVYVEPSFRGLGDKPLEINPFRLRTGTLEITADRLPEELRPLLWGREYTSGVITTKGTFSQMYGVFEMRARLPKGQGLWPAFWLLPANGAWPPELDIMEVLGHDTTTLYTTWHSKETGAYTREATVTHVPDMSADFHVYGLEWEKDVIKWFFDGIEIARAPTPADMHVPMQILANLTVGGNWPKNPDTSTPFPAVFAIDWIRAYQRR